jgi:hypothetical protein
MDAYSFFIKSHFSPGYASVGPHDVLFDLLVCYYCTRGSVATTAICCNILGHGECSEQKKIVTEVMQHHGCNVITSITVGLYHQ